MDLNEFKTTQFYTTTKKYFLETPFKGEVMSEETAEEILTQFYWTSYANDTLNFKYLIN